MAILKFLLATPVMWIWYALVGALVLLRGSRKERRTRAGWYMLLAGFLIFTLLSFAPFAGMIARPLLERYPAPSSEMLHALQVITVLGGGGGEGVPSEATKERIFAGVEMFKQSGAKFIAVQGSSEIDGEPTDAEIMKKIALEQGIPEEKILVDPSSRTTAEHPARLQALLPSDITRIGIVTSATHMPRAMRIFRNYFTKMELVALPVGSIIEKSQYRFIDMIPSVNALSSSTATLHEWVGILWYKMRLL